jgi:hypothetical protein
LAVIAGLGERMGKTGGLRVECGEVIGERWEGGGGARHIWEGERIAGRERMGRVLRSEVVRL